MNARLAPSPQAYRVVDDGAVDMPAAAVDVWRGSLPASDALLRARFNALVRSPHGAPVLRAVEHEADGVVGFLALAPRPMRCGARALRAGVLSHFAILPEHRSLGPALMLIEAVLQAASDRFDLAYGIPNAHQGASAVLRRGGFRPLAELERSVRIVRHGPYLARRTHRALATPAGLAVDAADAMRRHWSRLRRPRLRARWVEQHVPEMDAPWAASGPHAALAAVRDGTMLRWRFDQGVGTRIRYLLVEDAAGTVQAWFACGVEERWPHVLDVHDFWSADARDGIATEAITLLLSEARRRGHASVSLRAAMSEAAAAPWRASGFRSRDAQQVLVRWFDPDLAASPPVPHMTYLDQDG